MTTKCLSKTLPFKRFVIQEDPRDDFPSHQKIDSMLLQLPKT